MAILPADQFLRRRMTVASLAVCFAATSIAKGLPPSQIGGAAEIRIDQAWIETYPVTQVAYATLTNTSDKFIEIKGADGDCCGSVAMVRADLPHRSTPVKNIQIKPHQTLAFKGNHVHFLINRAKVAIEKQQQVSLTLHFSDGTSKEIPFDVRKPHSG
jgi:copper(I)-binding protein